MSNPTMSPRVRCKMCRRYLAGPDNLSHHLSPTEDARPSDHNGLSDPDMVFSENNSNDQGEEGRSHGPHNRSKLIDEKCSGYFVQPMQWMTFLNEGATAGKIPCPNDKCSAKLGNFDWSGLQCGCGEWVTPGFCIHRSKVDEIV